VQGHIAPFPLSWRGMKTMAESIAAERLRWIKPILNKETSIEQMIKVCPFSDRTIKRLHALDEYCSARGIAHYLIDPGKPAQNGMVERSHRSDQERFYDPLDFAKMTEKKLKNRLRAWNEEYNNLEHCGLNGLTPNEALRVQNVLA